MSSRGPDIPGSESTTSYRHLTDYELINLLSCRDIKSPLIEELRIRLEHAATSSNYYVEDDDCTGEEVFEALRTQGFLIDDTPKTEHGNEYSTFTITCPDCESMRVCKNVFDK